MAARTISIDDIQFNVLVEGPASGPVVVLSHALMANLKMWDETVPALHSFGYRTIRYDALGHGKTSCPSGLTKPSFEDFTHHIHKLAKACAEDNTQPKLAAVIGCSMGGVLAIRYAMLYPEYVDAVMCCAAPGMTAIEGRPKMWGERVEKFATGTEGKNELCKVTVDRWVLGSEPHDDYVKQKALEMCHSCTFEGYRACAHAISHFDYEGELGKVKHKVLIVRGELDSNVGPPEVLEAVAQKVGDHGCQLETIEGAGHLPPLHRSEQFNKVMQDFLGSADGSVSNEVERRSSLSGSPLQAGSHVWSSVEFEKLN